MARFHFVQKYDQYTDYDTVLGNLTDADMTENERRDWAEENVRRLTLVDDDGKQSAYLTLRDFSEQQITYDEGKRLLAEGGIDS